MDLSFIVTGVDEITVTFYDEEQEEITSNKVSDLSILVFYTCFSLILQSMMWHPNSISGTTTYKHKLKILYYNQVTSDDASAETPVTVPFVPDMSSFTIQATPGGSWTLKDISAKVCHEPGKHSLNDFKWCWVTYYDSFV